MIKKFGKLSLCTNYIFSTLQDSDGVRAVGTAFDQRRGFSSLRRNPFAKVLYLAPISNMTVAAKTYSR
jgi:hypothetical protein